MAIYTSVPPPNQQPSVDIDTWTLHALQNLDITPLLTSTTQPPLQIPLHDSLPGPAPKARVSATATGSSKPKLPSTVSKRRELAEKGKEGSRRRQRWENDRLVGVPGVVAPSAADWTVGSTSPVRKVPYYLAPLWEGSEVLRRGKKGEREERGRVPGDLRERIRRGKVEGELLRRLEGEVRRFVVEWVEESGDDAGVEMEKGQESSDEEVVFVGRDLSARTIRLRDEERAAARVEKERERCVFEASVGDRGGALGRYLVHALAGYYGLRSWSVTVGGGRRAVVGIREGGGEVPRPLYAIV